MSLYFHRIITDGDLDQSTLTALELPPFDNADTTLVKPEWVGEYFENEFLPMNLMYDAELGTEPTIVFLALFNNDYAAIFGRMIEHATKSRFVTTTQNNLRNRADKWLVSYFELWLESNIDRLKGAE